jgi:hypothetical protein
MEKKAISFVSLGLLIGVLRGKSCCSEALVNGYGEYTIMDEADFRLFLKRGGRAPNVVQNVATLPAEARFTVETARKLPRLVEYT